MENDITDESSSPKTSVATKQQQKPSVVISASRQELLNKIDQLKKRLKLGMQFAYVTKICFDF